MPVTNRAVVASLLGVSSHLLYFRKGEHHLWGIFYLKLFLVSVGAVATLLSRFGGPDENVAFDNEHVGWKHALFQSLIIHGFYLAGVFTSLTVYRAFFHPLRKFPGPFDLRISSLSLAWRVRRFDANQRVQDLHAKYGTFFRIGPNAVSVIHPSVMKLVHGSDSRFSKGDFYDLLWPMKSLQMLRNKAEHGTRRRVWSAAFSDRALRGYEKRMAVYQDKLLAKLGAAAMRGEPINMTRWSHAYSTDVASDLSFGKAFGNLDSEKNHWVIDVMEAGTVVLGLMLPVWLFKMLSDIPGANKDFLRWLYYARDSMLARMKTTPELPDMASALLAPLQGRKGDPTTEELNILTGDSQLVIGAGSDTTSSTLTVIIYFLAKYPDEVAKLRAELDPLLKASDSSFPTSEKLVSLQHLNGVINEALRLYPVVPTATYRQAPPEGVTIAGTFIPGGTNVWTPQYAIGRSKEIFAEPDRFVPERWYKYPDMVKEPSAFAPFLTGPFSCIGRPLALQNLRNTVSKLVYSFDFSLPVEAKNFQADIKDRWILGVPELPLVVAKRTNV